MISTLTSAEVVKKLQKKLVGAAHIAEGHAKQPIGTVPTGIQDPEQQLRLKLKLKKETAGTGGKAEPDQESLMYDSLDLNKLSDAELDAHKKKMDEVFFKHYKDPKAPDFVYDLEVSPPLSMCSNISSRMDPWMKAGTWMSN